jgi:hypothetical protein
MIPTEAEEQAVFVQWLRLKGIHHFRVPNETYTKSWKQKAMNKALGVSSGVPDLFLLVDNQMIAIEMKRIKGGKTTPNQKEWLARLNAANVPALVCNGAKEAIAFVESHIQ